MSEALTAEDLRPILQKLPLGERIRVARLALEAVGGMGDRAAYVARPPSVDEVSADDDGLSWEAEGWDELAPAR